MDAKGRWALGAAIVATGLALAGCVTTQKPPVAEAPPAPVEEVPKPVLVVAPPSAAVIAPTDTYRIGVDDELEVSVYGFDGLSVKQVVRPDGRIDVPVVGEIEALGLTPGELRDHIARDLAGSFANPRVSVLVRGYGSRRVNVIGQVRRPGSVTLGADRSMLRTLAVAGGLTDRADLHGALLVREGVAQPVSLEKLLAKGDLSQNVELQPNDTLIIPDVTDRKAIVLGEVKAPQVVSLKGQVTVMEAVVRAQGFTRGSAKGRIVVVRGGLEKPTVYELSANDVMKRGDLAQNMLLEHGDIVYVPKTVWATVVDIFVDISRIMQPAVLAETGIIIGPDMIEVLKTGSRDGDTDIVISP